MADGTIGDDAGEPAPRVEHVIAGPGRRLLGAAVDGAVWAAVATGLSSTLLRGDDAALAHSVTMAGLVAAYEIVSVARWGRTIGKLVAGTRIVATDSGAAPGWSQAVLRWAVPSVVGLVFLFLGDGLAAQLDPLVSGVVTIVVYVGVLRDPLRQGVHDKVAGTVVVLRSVTAPSPAGARAVRAHGGGRPRLSP